MTQPLALVVYEKLLPGTQLVNRLQDLGYRVQTVEDLGSLIGIAEQSGPIIVFADLESTRGDVLSSVAALRKNTSTSHLPVVAFGSEDTQEVRDLAARSGVTLLASDASIADHLPQVLEQALRID